MDNGQRYFAAELEFKILAHLGKAELLKSRLVCKSWNQHCMRIMQDSEMTQELSEQNFTHYFPTITEVSEDGHPCLFPFRLHLGRELAEEYGINEEDWDDSNSDSVLSTLTELVYHISLQRTRPGFLITELTLGPGFISPTTLHSLVQLLRLASCSLKRIDMSNFGCVPLDLFNEFVLVKLAAGIEFPRVTTLKCNMQYIGHKYDIIVRNMFFQGIINGCPRLKTFINSDGQLAAAELWRHFGHGFRGHLPFTSLKYVKLGKLYSCEDFLNSLKRCTEEPSVEKLVVHAESAEVLPVFSSRLKELTLLINQQDEFANSMQKLTTTFANVEHVKFALYRVSFEHCCTLLYLDPMDINLTNSGFPNLHSVEIPVHCVLIEPGPLASRSYDVMAVSPLKMQPILAFTKVTRLALRLYRGSFGPSSIFLSDNNLDGPLWRWRKEETREVIKVAFKEIVEYHQKMFPSLKKMIVINYKQRDLAGRESDVSHLLKALLQTEGASQITELELRNCDRNYLGELFFEMTDCKKVTLSLDNFVITPGVLRGFQALLAESQDRILDWKSSFAEQSQENAEPTKTIKFEEIPLHNQMKNLTRLRLIHYMDKLSSETGRTAPRYWFFGIPDVEVPAKGYVPATSHNTDLQHFKELAKNFPSLKIIQLSPYMLGASNEARAKAFSDFTSSSTCLILSI